VGFKDVLVLIKGAGDLASGVAYRVYRAGFPLVMTELPAPLVVRRTVSFAEAVHAGEVTIEGIMARRVGSAAEALRLALDGIIPLLVDPEAACRRELMPTVLVDAIMAKRNTGTHLDDAPLVVGLGPGFTAGVDCHAVVETSRGHTLGRVIWNGQAVPDTGVPGEVGGRQSERVLRAPAWGHVRALRAIGDAVQAGEVVAEVAGQQVKAPFSGVLRGLISEVVLASPGMKIGDVDPRAVREHCFTISDKSLAVGGGVMEAILSSAAVRAVLAK
jgi:xanthine dehydrogenase accessory factor